MVNIMAADVLATSGAWKHRTYKMRIMFIMSSVCLRRSLLASLSFMERVGYVWSADPIFFWSSREYLYFILISSNRKYDLLAIT